MDEGRLEARRLAGALLEAAGSLESNAWERVSG
jgi:hypothetical protein